MRTLDPEDYEQIHLETHEAYIACLERLRPHTASIEFVFHPQDAPNPLRDRVAEWVTDTRVGVPPRPGCPTPAPKSVLVTVRAHRDVFAILRSYEGFFRFLRGAGDRFGPRTGDRVEFTDFGNVDVVFRDRTGAIVLWTVTHEGLAFAHPDVL